MESELKLKASLLQAEERLASMAKERDGAMKEVARLQANNKAGAAELQKAICSLTLSLVLLREKTIFLTHPNHSTTTLSFYFLHFTH